MTFAFVARHRHIWPVSWMCEVLGVSRSGFHAWLRRPISNRAAYDAKLVMAIDKSFKASDRTYGARRVWRDVLEDGLACGLHRVERLMRQNAMRVRPKRRGKPKDDGERSVIADNILARDFEADRPNQKWLADFTYIWTAEGWLSSDRFMAVPCLARDAPRVAGRVNGRAPVRREIHDSTRFPVVFLSCMRPPHGAASRPVAASGHDRISFPRR
ncbi:hypothetical protein FIU97_02440 [Roseivivax sp. THAF40]|nr:hypothetical protein FIU97_02440 [Roseivivax sp. THAF40]